MINRKLRSLLGLAVFILSINSYAYTFTSDFNSGIYWESFPLEMKKFVINSSEGPLLKSLVDESINEWESVTGMNIWESLGDAVTSTNFSGNNIRWSNNFAAETGYDPQNTLAVTVRYNQGVFLTKTEIILNGNLTYLRQNFASVLKKTILHELGHTIGLDHSTVQAIMAPYIGAVQELQTDDIEGAIAVLDETSKRQEPSYIEAIKQKQSSDPNNMAAACGTVSFSDSDDSNYPPFLVSLILGALMTLAFKFSLRENFAAFK